MSPQRTSRGASLHVHRWKETNYGVVNAENRLTIESAGESVSIPVEVAGGQQNQITQRALTWCGACEVWPKTGTPFGIWKRGKLFPRSHVCVRVRMCASKHQVYTCNWFIPYLPSALILRLGLPDSPEFVIMPKLYPGLEKFWHFLTSGCRNWRKVNYGFM